MAKEYNPNDFVTTKVRFYGKAGNLSRVEIDWVGSGSGTIRMTYNHDACKWLVDTDGMGLDFARMLVDKLYADMVEYL